MTLDQMAKVKEKMMTLDQMAKVRAKMKTPDQTTNSMYLATVLKDVQTPGSVMFTGAMTPVGTKPVIGTEEIVTMNTVPHQNQNVVRDVPTRRLVTDGVTMPVMLMPAISMEAIVKSPKNLKNVMLPVHNTGLAMDGVTR